SAPPLTTHSSSLSLHDALPISLRSGGGAVHQGMGNRLPSDEGMADHCAIQIQLGGYPGLRRDQGGVRDEIAAGAVRQHAGRAEKDRKSTRLNSSHVKISYAVFC